MIHKSPLPFGTVLFCDDVRQEVGGKVSLIGLYNERMLFPAGTSFPVTLPKLGVRVEWFEDLDARHEEVKFQIGMRHFETSVEAPDDQVFFEICMDLKEVRAKGVSQELKGIPDVRGHAFPTMVISPCVVPFPGILRARAIIGDEIWPLSTLKIEVSPEQAATLAPSQ